MEDEVETWADPCSCGSIRVMDNYACGDPECCGPRVHYCADCGETRGVDEGSAW
jgi:hypothetical protein